MSVFLNKMWIYIYTHTHIVSPSLYKCTDIYVGVLCICVGTHADVIHMRTHLYIVYLLNTHFTCECMKLPSLIAILSSKPLCRCDILTFNLILWLCVCAYYLYRLQQKYISNINHSLAEDSSGLMWEVYLPHYV